MSSCDQKELVMRQPFDACISRVRLKRERFQSQPVTKGFGIKSQQTTTLAQRHDGHEETSFQGVYDKDHDECQFQSGIRRGFRFWEAEGEFSSEMSREFSPEISREFSSEMSREC